MAQAQILVDGGFAVRLTYEIYGFKIISFADFGAGLWLLTVESPKIAPDGPKMLEAVVWDSCGEVPLKFKRWAEL